MDIFNTKMLSEGLAEDKIKREELPFILYETLSARGITFGSAESCTGGLISAAMTAVPGVSGIFLGGVCAYSNEIKTKLLDVPKDVLSSFGAVSSETAFALAKGAQKSLGVNFSVSTTGLAGPGGGTEAKPVGLVYMGFAAFDEIFTVRGEFWDSENPTRESIRRAATDSTLYIALKTAKRL